MKKIILFLVLLFALQNTASAQSSATAADATLDFKTFKKMYFQTPAMQAHLTTMKNSNIELYKEYVKNQDTTVRLYKRYVESGESAYLTELNNRKSKYGLPISW